MHGAVRRHEGALGKAGDHRGRVIMSRIEEGALRRASEEAMRAALAKAAREKGVKLVGRLFEAVASDLVPVSVPPQAAVRGEGNAAVGTQRASVPPRHGHAGP